MCGPGSRPTSRKRPSSSERVSGPESRRRRTPATGCPVTLSTTSPSRIAAGGSWAESPAVSRSAQAGRICGNLMVRSPGIPSIDEG